MQFYTPEELDGKIPDKLIKELNEAHTNYKTAKQNLELHAKQNAEVETLKKISQEANDYYLIAKRINDAIKDYFNSQSNKERAYGC